MFLFNLIPHKSIFRSSFRLWIPGLFVCMLFLRCAHETPEEAPDRRLAGQFALDWNDLLLNLERNTSGYRPPVSARMLAYVELAGYESCLPALPENLSMENYLSGFKKPDVVFDKNDFSLPASLNAAYGQILRSFFPTAPRPMLEAIDKMESEHAGLVAGRFNAAQISRSVAFGKSVADAVWTWSVTDQVGHDGFLYNYDKNYSAPDCPGCWQPSGSHSMPPLTPHWGEVRPFIAHPEDIVVKPPLSFSEVPGSSFYTDAMEVFTISQPLSRENLWIAEFWSDDVPGLTLTPAGRWISIANQAIEKRQPQLPEIMEIYLKTSMALCDAGIICWKAKYRFNLERPQTYIRRIIQPDWKSLHENPSFPSYPSGHSIFGAAAAEVLTQTLGDRFAMTDRTHEDRPEFASTPRSYNSFNEMAKENALSRVALGVHYRMDCEEGLRLGKIVGQKIAALPLRKSEAARR
jgi:hypothetical protein